MNPEDTEITYRDKTNFLCVKIVGIPNEGDLEKVEGWLAYATEYVQRLSREVKLRGLERADAKGSA